MDRLTLLLTIVVIVEVIVLLLLALRRVPSVSIQALGGTCTLTPSNTSCTLNACAGSTWNLSIQGVPSSTYTITVVNTQTPVRLHLLHTLRHYRFHRCRFHLRLRRRFQHCHKHQWSRNPQRRVPGYNTGIQSQRHLLLRFIFDLLPRRHPFPPLLWRYRNRIHRWRCTELDLHCHPQREHRSIHYN